MNASITETTIIQDCIQNKRECEQCKYCGADKLSWEKLENDFKITGKNYLSDLQSYFLIRRKRKIFEDNNYSKTLGLTEAEGVIMFGRY